jgi:sigma-B regulation protein RsbU (phosphoserine phosphatase)
MYPARTVAGDYYGFIELTNGEIAVVIADVSGKGVAAGLLMPSIEVALRMDAPRFPRTSDLLHAFNNVVQQITVGRRFITLFYGKLCAQSRSLEYTNAGLGNPFGITTFPRPRLLAYFKVQEHERPNPRPLDLKGVVMEALGPK